MLVFNTTYFFATEHELDESSIKPRRTRDISFVKTLFIGGIPFLMLAFVMIYLLLQKGEVSY